MTNTAALAKLLVVPDQSAKKSGEALSYHYVIMAMISLHSGHIYSNARIGRDLKIRCLSAVGRK